MLKYTNTLNTKWKKMKDGYQNDLFQSDLDANYRWQLRSLIGKVVVIESLDYEIQTKTLESETGEYEVKEILLRDAQVTRVNPYDNESLPLILDHIWVMVGNDLELDKEYSKVKIKGTVGEYLKSSGVKDIGIDAEYCHFNDGKNIVVPKNYQGTKGFDEVEEKREENPVVCPKEFEHMVLNAKECEFLGLWKMYGWKEIKDVPFSIVKSFGGPFKFTNMFNKIKNMEYVDEMYDYLLSNEGKVFNINELSYDERLKLIGKITSDVVANYRYNDKDYYSLDDKYDSYYLLKEKSYRIYRWQYCGVVDEIIRNININATKRTVAYKKLLLLSESGLVTIGEGHIGTYEREMAEYNKLMKEREAQIKKLREEYGSLEIQIKELEKPVNKDYTYYYAIPTEEAINLVRWFGKEVPGHMPLQEIPNT